MENETIFIYVWGYNGMDKVDKNANERYCIFPHKFDKTSKNKKVLNLAPDVIVGLGHALISVADKVLQLTIAHLPSCNKTDNQGSPASGPLHICQHEDRTYLICNNGPCHVVCQRPDKLEHSIVKGDGGTENVKLKFVDAGDLYTVGISDKCEAGSITKDSTEYIFRPFVPVITCKQVCCGKEHVLLLSADGKVYSFGLGSRGQLGHGVTDKQDKPKLIEAIESVSMATISAGGWHSAAVSDIQDLYIWGWNESGQLGFKMKTSKRSNVKDHPSTNHKCQKNLTASKSPKSSSSDRRDNKGDNLCSSSQGTDVINTKDVDFESSEDDCVLFHSLPEILDLPGGHDVSKVSCGSRHSAAVTDDGHVYTWGWGEYGQLGHGDRLTRDIPSRVQYFTENNLTVTDVLCQGWNTVVSTKVNTSLVT